MWALSIATRQPLTASAVTVLLWMAFSVLLSPLHAEELRQTNDSSSPLVSDSDQPSSIAADVLQRLSALEESVLEYRAENELLKYELWKMESQHAQHSVPSVASPQLTETAAPLKPSWQRQLRFESRDGDWSIHVGGNAQWDSVWLVGPHGVFDLPSGNTNGTENLPATLIRRGRFRFDGSIYSQFDYVVEFDLANAANENKGLQSPTIDNIASSPIPTNVWMQIRDFYGLGNVRIGKQVKPLGMSNNTSQTFLPFIERSYNMDAFYGPFDEGFTTGIMSINWTDDERMTWRYGIFRPADDPFGIAINNCQVAGRVTALPIDEDEGRRLVHIGLGAVYDDLVQGERRIRARPVLRNGPGYAVPLVADTGQIPAHNHVIIGPEFAAVYGSLTIQAEYAAEFLNEAVVGGVDQGTVFYQGGYCELLYFLTGEHQHYEKHDAAFGRVVPQENLRLHSGDGFDTFGAWQVGARFGFLDVNDKAVRGGQVYDWTLGLNLFLNPNMKIQFNYMLLNREGQQGVGNGWINGFGTRAAWDF